MSIVWILRWDLGDDVFEQRVLPDPCVQIVVDPERASVMGVVTGAFSVTLTGSRLVLGLKFRAGGFYPFIRRPVWSFTNQTVPVSQCFHVDDSHLVRRAALGDGPGIVAALETLLRDARPVMDDSLEEVFRMADAIAADATLLTVEQAAREFGVRPRSLQRAFRRYIGVGPKWMIRRCRIQEAAARLESGDVPTLSDLAGSLGYADQSHFINDFRRLVGRSPTRYTQSLGHDRARASRRVRDAARSRPQGR